MTNAFNGHQDENAGMDRRRFLGLASGAIAASSASGLLAACGSAGTRSPAGAINSHEIRLQSVITPVDSGLMGHPLSRFERQTGYRVQITTAEDVYGPARAGKADLVISHYGHRDVREFVLGGYGEWPRTVFQNQLALVGPPSDPAHVGGLIDLVEAYRQIARTESAYAVNAAPELRYLHEIINDAAGDPAKGSWYHDPGQKGQGAVRYAAEHQAHTIFGVTPFMVGQAQRRLRIVPLLLGDPMLLRVMVTIVVNPQKVGGVNHAGALALQQHLLTPKTQAEIRDYRVPGVKVGLWWPAGRNNEAALLPLTHGSSGPGSGAGNGSGGGGGGGGGNGRNSPASPSVEL
jgi:tungstate transport system substrate-binding protein